MQPKERISSIAYLLLSSKICTKLSYRDAAEMINLFFHRDSQDSIKLRTLSDSMDRIGGKISAGLEDIAGKVLKMYGFNKETGIPDEGVRLSENITAPCVQHPDPVQLQAIVDGINASREEKIPFTADKLDIETGASDCVYVSIDDIGVKRQKGSRGPESMKGPKYVENTVVHIQHGQDTYALTAVGMMNAMKSTLAFLIFNGLLCNNLIFFSDGARNIKNSIETVFSFHPYTIILDWFHLKKKCQELLSMALKGKEARNEALEKLLRILWAGDVEGAVSYLESLPPLKVKNQKWLDEQVGYLERKKDAIACYAVRAALNLRNSSNCVEKENDILVAQRQKHNGMSWSKQGSGSLAAIEMVFQNGYEDIWFSQERISFTMPGKKSLDFCA